MNYLFKNLMRGQNFGVNRLEAFSDGVFAIVITLLVLELRVPEVHGPDMSQQLRHGLFELLPKFVSFIVSFIYVSIYWINHHQLFHHLKRSDRGLFWLNSLFLMFLTFIPFPTAFIGSYPEEPVAVILYGAEMFAAALTFVFMKIYIFSGPALIESGQKRKAKPLYYVLGPAAYLAAIFIALLSTKIAIAIYILIPVAYFFAAEDN